MAWFSRNNSMNISNSVIMSGRGKTIINGVEYDVPTGANISVINNKVYIDNKEITNNKELSTAPKIKIEIHGDVRVANVHNNLIVNGDVTTADVGNNLTVSGNIKGDADAGNNIIASKIYGNVDAGNNVIGR